MDYQTFAPIDVPDLLSTSPSSVLYKTYRNWLCAPLRALKMNIDAAHTGYSFLDDPLAPNAYGVPP